MGTLVMDSRAFEAKSLRAEPVVQTEYVVIRDSLGQGIRGQSAAWRLALWVLLSTAVLFLVVKCAIQLSFQRGTSVRILAEGGGSWPKGKHQPLRDSDEEETTCAEGSGTHRTDRNKTKAPRWLKWWKAKHSYKELGVSTKGSEKDEEPPSTTAIRRVHQTTGSERFMKILTILALVMSDKEPLPNAAAMSLAE
ncbi:hypothetical protein, conserved [Eimeria brunetti]|uniref:Uncharacterized protein n=1 Tax=Eimeria brunetti TaxID=51314 RepID=U6LQN3_9EIME|nr:hypothetical protein, conserved [Eimeria brunetti]